MTKIAATRLGARYGRIVAQLGELFAKTDDTTARMATAAAVLHHKMPHFSWTGFYCLKGDRLVVGPYQGPLACAVLPAPQGVCWAGVQRGASLLVPDVSAFPGHVVCDARSRSEVVVPLRDQAGEIIGVLDVDSDEVDAFQDEDLRGLEQITAMICSAVQPGRQGS